MTEETYKIGMLLISTSRERDWKNIKESYLYKIFLKSFLLTMDEIFQYVIYIGIDKNGNIAMEMNTNGMYRAHMNSKGDIIVKIYSDE